MSTPNEEKIKRVFSERINELIGENSVSAFARRVGLKQAAIDRYVKGLRVPAADALVAIASECAVSIDWLLGVTSNPNGEDQSEWRARAIAAESKLDRVNRALGHALKGFEELQEAVK